MSRASWERSVRPPEGTARSGQGDQIDEKYFPSYGEQILSLISLVPELLVS